MDTHSPHYVSDPTQAKNHARRSLFAPIAYGLLIAFFLAFGLAAWGTYRVALFLKELPNRIVIDIDEQVAQQFFTESTIFAMREGEKPQRLEIINYLETVGPDAEAFLEALDEASTDPDAEIAAAARAAIEAIRKTDSSSGV